MSWTPILRSLWIGVQASWLEMASNRFRSVLTLAGVALAVGVVTVMTAMQTGTQAYVKTLVQEMGGVGRVGLRTEAANTPLEETVFARSPGIRLDNADTLNSQQNLSLRASRIAEARLGVTYLGQTRETEVHGVDEATLAEDEKALVESGRFPNAFEYSQGARVAVVGWKVAELMRKIKNDRASSRQNPAAQEPVNEWDGDSPDLSGDVVRIAGTPYTVVGVFTRRFTRWDRPGWWVYIPIQSLLRDFTGANPAVDWMNVKLDADDPEAMVEGPLTAFVKKLHRGAQDFGFRFFDFIGEYSTMMNNLRLVFGLISIIALVVGGVNILNVMLSTLADRIQEIGVRKALGAGPMQIFLQFLVESVTLSLAGGCLGSLLGSPVLLFSAAIEKATHGIAPSLDFAAFVWIFSLTMLMGVVSGIYPAIKAARLMPIDALRYE